MRKSHFSDIVQMKGWSFQKSKCQYFNLILKSAFKIKALPSCTDARNKINWLLQLITFQELNKRSWIVQQNNRNL